MRAEKPWQGQGDQARLNGEAAAQGWTRQDVDLLSPRAQRRKSCAAETEILLEKSATLASGADPSADFARGAVRVHEHVGSKPEARTQQDANRTSASDLEPGSNAHI